MSKFLLPFREGQNTLNRFSPTGLFLSAIASAVVIAILINPLFVLIGFLLAITVGSIARTRWRVVLSLVAKFELIIMFWVLLEPFMYGTTILYTFTTPFGPLNVYEEGLIFGILLGLRMITILTIFSMTLSHMTLTEFISALRTLRVPPSILGSLLIMLRYVPLFMTERRRMQEAQSLRGFELGERWDRIKSLGYLVGTTIDRAMERSVSVYEAMKLRGYGSGMKISGAGFKRSDSILAFAVLLFVLSSFFLFPYLLEVVLL